MTSKVNEIVAAIKELPPFPKVAQRIMVMLDDPHVAVSKLAEVIQLDSSLTANALKTVNSALYGLPKRVDSINTALTLLGNKRFKEVVVTSFTASLLNSAQPGYDMSRGELWRHSLATALMTQVISEMAGQESDPGLYTAALLHDIGKVILSSFIGEEIPHILDLVNSRGRSFLEAEREVLGLDHARLGGLIAKNWDFSTQMEALISFHHEPEKKEDWLGLAVLYLANLVCGMMGLGGGVDGLAYRGREKVMKFLGFREKDLELAMAELHVRLVKAESILETDD